MFTDKQIVLLGQAIAKGVKCNSRATKFSNDQQLNLEQLGNGFGVRSLTIQNTGTAFIILDDVGQIIASGESFTIFTGNNVLSNTDFSISFGGADPSAAAGLPPQEGVLRYLVDVDCK